MTETTTAAVVDSYLHSDTGFTYFRSHWEHHTASGTCPAEAPLTGADFSSRGSAFFKRDTDLVGGVYIHIVLPRAPGVRWVDCVGLAAIESVQVRLGGALVDTLDGGGLALHHRALNSRSEWQATRELAGHGLDGCHTQSVYVALPGLLGRTPGRGFPLLVSPNTPLQVTVGLVAAHQLAACGAPPVSGARVSLVYESTSLPHLDAAELFSTPFRSTVQVLYAQTASNYTWDADLDMVTSTSVTFDLSRCLGACKYVAWTCRPAGAPSAAEGHHLTANVALTLNGDIFTGAAAQVHADPTTYRLLMPWQRLARYDGSCYVLTFALRPRDYQPTGETRLDLGTSQLILTLTPGAGAVDVSLLVGCYAAVDFDAGTATVVYT